MYISERKKKKKTKKKKKKKKKKNTADSDGSAPIAVKKERNARLTVRVKFSRMAVTTRRFAFFDRASRFFFFFFFSFFFLSFR